MMSLAKSVLGKRSFSASVSCMEHALVFKDHGEPTQVVRCHQFQLNAPAPEEARVRFRLSALNPADINVIQGKYPVVPPKRDELGGQTIVGNEGLGEVEELGDGASSTGLSVGDMVICGKSQLGTWASATNIRAEHLIKLPKSKSLKDAQGAMLAVNPATAYRLLKDFADLQEGDWVVQNASNSAAGQAVIQLCKAWGFKSINIVRDRDDIDALRSKLTSLGATHVLTTSELEDKGVRQKIKSWTGGAPVRLGLNCVSGPTTSQMASRIMSDKAVLVTYGAMSKKPLELPSSLLIFNGLTATGFWLSKWYETQPASARADMAAELVKLYEQGKLTEPEHEIVELKGDDDAITQTAREAIRRSTEGFGGKKLLFRFAQ